ncbi:MAG: hypothetical protein NC177_16400 [Ruminococcus flavefaciens]|nr:hypothetical protein [Ruminococcus flavefaciens]
MQKEKKYEFDLDGSEVMSRILLDLINQFPGLSKDKSIKFSTLDETSGIGFFPSAGAAILSSRENIVGHVRQICAYPFDVVYRAAPKTESQKLKIKEFLDTLGKWLELQTVSIDGTEHKLKSYPAVNSDSRVIKSISRTTPGHLNATYNDGVEDWVISATLKYENEFDK